MIDDEWMQDFGTVDLDTDEAPEFVDFESAKAINELLAEYYKEENLKSSRDDDYWDKLWKDAAEEERQNEKRRLVPDVPKCECGVLKVDKDAKPNSHSTWCRLYVKKS